MLKENETIRERLIPPAWEEYDGTGVNILLLDWNGKILDYMKPYTVLVDPEGKMVNEEKHNTYTMQIIHEFAPGATIYVCPWNFSKPEIEAYVRSKPSGFFDLANVSLSSPKGTDYDFLLDLGIVTTCAAGNGGDQDEDGVDFPANLPWTIAVGAEGKSYSNGGKMLNCVAPTDITVLRGNGQKFKYTGTSSSNPVVNALLARYICWQKKNGQARLLPYESVELVNKISMDIEEKGFDYASGYGLFCLPESLPIIEKGDDTMEIRPCAITMADYHHTAGNEKNAEQIRQVHMGPPNYWGDIGYNLVVLPSGEIEWGRDIKYSGAHDPGPAPDGSGYTMNQRAFAIACIGNFDEKEMLETQYQGLLKAAVWTHNRFGLSLCDHHRHRDQYATECPGDKFPWERLMSDLKKEIEGDEDVLGHAVVYFTVNDFSIAKVVADKLGGCAMFCRNANNAIIHKEAKSAKHLVVIGGAEVTDHPNVTNCCGYDAPATAILAAQYAQSL